MVSDNILVTKLTLKEAARCNLISLKASSCSPRYIEAMELALRLFTDYAKEKFRAYRNRAIVWRLIDTPIRCSEISGLRVDDVDLDAAMVKVLQLLRLKFGSNRL